MTRSGVIFLVAVFSARAAFAVPPGEDHTDPDEKSAEMALATDEGDTADSAEADEEAGLKIDEIEVLESPIMMESEVELFLGEESEVEETTIDYTAQ